MEVVFTYEGEEYCFTHAPDDHIGRWQAGANGFYEAPLLAELRKRVAGNPGIVIDVGAHIGNHTVFFAKVMHRVVIAVEPNDEVFPHLVRNVNAAGIAGRVTALGCAAGAYPGRWCSVPREERTRGNTGMQRVAYTQGKLDVNVPTKLCVPLDMVLPRETRVALVKLDVEGFEVAALSGMLTTILKYRPLLAIEAVSAGALKEQKALLSSAGYHPSERSWGKTPVYIWSHG